MQLLAASHAYNLFVLSLLLTSHMIKEKLILLTFNLHSNCNALINLKMLHWPPYITWAFHLVSAFRAFVNLDVLGNKPGGRPTASLTADLEVTHSRL
jgi:hypothetical protein